MKALFLAVLLILAPISVCAQSISDVFSSGAIGVSWGQTLEEVKLVHPSGKVKTYGKAVHYIIKHEKPILKIPRDDTNVTFAFNPDGKLHSIMIGFDGDQFADVLTAANSYFGPGQSTPNNFAVRIDWPIEDGLSLYLLNIAAGFSTETNLIIENTNPLTQATKEELGFE